MSIARLARHAAENKTARKFLTFALAGVPAFLVAIPGNYLLVSRLGWSKPLAYMVVVFAQTIVNFFLCRWFVFEAANQGPIVRQFLHFISGLGAFRLLDWAAYSVMVTYFGVPYLLAQMINLTVLFALKFRFSLTVFERRPATPPSPAPLLDSPAD